MQKISELTLAERDDYVCRQSIAVLQSCGYDMPLEIALDYLLDSESQDGYRPVSYTHLTLPTNREV